ncbi:glycosyltransferase family 2 protein [Candidatus Roizmanbacteria bacterium]|nr:glycosyltransferase family 2 protein [Candidatus Roizmanbacteria bacterium]
MTDKKIYIVIPVFNESRVIKEVISEVQQAGYKNLIIVDDGSGDDTYSVANTVLDVIVLRHRVNRGKGAAIKTGISVADICGAEVIVTIDGDGQHDPFDIQRLIKPITEDGYDVALGTRMLHSDGMPLLKIIANKIGNFCTLMLYGILVSDSQSGFRAYSRYAAGIIDTKADKYEYDSKVIREINYNRLRFIEVPIKVRYTEYSMAKKHKQGFVNGMKTLARMVWDKLI